MGCFQFCENTLRWFLYDRTIAGNFVVWHGSDSPAVAAAAPNQNARQNVVCLRKKMSAFYSMNFREFPKTNGTAFTEFMEKRTALRGVPKFSAISYLELPYNLTFLPEFSKFPVKWFALRKFNNFQIFWKPSQEMSVSFVPVSKFSEFSVKWKALNVLRCKNVALLTVSCKGWIDWHCKSWVETEISLIGLSVKLQTQVSFLIYFHYRHVTCYSYKRSAR